MTDTPTQFPVTRISAMLLPFIYDSSSVAERIAVSQPASTDRNGGVKDVNAELQKWDLVLRAKGSLDKPRL
ncbi:hypothetical protein NXS19_011341 [Fusarium pseudograminearum]|nr:hypothetical protein NXS19_011341 [Fusarium pseudograminearum]